MKRCAFLILGVMLMLGGLAACDSNGEQAADATPESGAAPDSLTPVDVSGLSSGAASVAAGFFHTCAVTTEGDVKCWGRNALGQLGNGTTADSATPVDVVGLESGATAVVVGDRHTCALTTEDSVKCWGSNLHGQVGDDTPNHKTEPVDVIGLESDVTAISAGAEYVCALTTSGGVKCWGENTVGQLGDGTSTDRSVPVDVAGLTQGVAVVVAGEVHTCAVTGTGAVKCWGANNRGQLGNETTTSSDTPNPTPVDAATLKDDVAAVAVGYLHTCVLTTEGAVKCWGGNKRGQLGDGTTTDSLTVVDVAGLTSGVVAIDAGRSHTCALTAAGDLTCWGGNERGQLGDGTTTDRTTPVDVTGLEGPVVAMDVGKTHTCAVTTEGGVKCWGRNDGGQLGATDSSLEQISATPEDAEETPSESE